MQARFTRHARSELLGQVAYDKAIEVDLGARFRSEVEAAAHPAAAFPLRGRPSEGGTRRRLIAGFPFSLIYTQEEYGVLSHPMADSRRLPDYWLGRVR